MAILLGLCINQLGEKAEALKKLLVSCDEVIQLYLKILINKVGPIAIFCLISRTFAIYGVESVSYTHLDVYKRQVLRFGFRPGKIYRLALCAFEGQYAVSYTHLDVYKRQMQDGLTIRPAITTV